MKKLFLTEKEVYNAIIDYCKQGNDNELSVEKSIYIYDDEIILDFYLIEKVQRDKITHTSRYKLTNLDLKDAFNYYLEKNNCELDTFKYVGGIRRVGYFIDEDTAHFEGIELAIKDKSLKRRRLLSSRI